MNRALWMTVLTLLIGASLAMAQDYARAEQFLTWNLLTRVYHDQVTPNWFRDSTRFWYRVNTRSGFQFTVVDPRSATQSPLFDNGLLAEALSRASGRAVDPTKLPFEAVDLERDGAAEGRTIAVTFGPDAFRCDVVAYRCESRHSVPASTRLVRSPDARWDAFVFNSNVWVRPAEGGDSIQLTTDGTPDFGYGGRVPNATLIRRHLEERPTLYWSPDSRAIAVFRYDERNVERTSMVSLTERRPILYRYPYALPGDSVVPMADVHLVEVATRSNRRVEYPPQPVASRYTGPQASLYSLGDNPIVWGPRSDRVYFTHVDRGPKHVRLLEAQAATGLTRVLLTDSSNTAVIGGVDPQSVGTNWRILGNGDVIFFSERDGFGHLARYGPNGVPRNQITQGPWMVMALIAVDELVGRVYFTAVGREPGHHPDYRHFYSVGLDGTGLTLLSPENADHAITPVPTGGYFIDSYSRVDHPPATVLRNAAGRVVKELEQADISNLREIGWKPPRIFTAKARDGITELTGLLWTPSNFDATKRYPVVDHIYPGPLFSPVDKAFFPPRESGLSYATMGQAQALAELGFVVFELDALGNVPRSKASYTTWWGNMADNGLPDHVSVLKQLGARFPWLDLERVGIYGYSGGGFASTAAMLRYPDFFKVAVSLAGNHDARAYNFGWGERFQGLVTRDSARGTDNYENVANKRLANRLQGHLLLIHGDLDDNVHPANTVQLVDALIKANKSFDLLMVPNANHSMSQHPYVIRRTWDYFVEHLMGKEPPRDYRITPP